MGFTDNLMGFSRPGKRLQFANLKMAIEIVSFPINSMVDLSIAMLVYQRVSLLKDLDQ